jgi:ABC-type glycerol-3-phosphate transport system substrate-binding protein
LIGKQRARKTARWVPVVLVVLVAAALAGTASGISGGSDRTQATTISYLTHWGPDQVAMLNAAAAAFHDKNPDITVQIRAVPFANLLSTIRTQGSSPNGPTIASIYDLWLPELVRDRLSAPVPANVARSVRAGWPKNLVANVTKGGAIRGLPNEVDLYALNYNKKLFARAGIAGPPKTWTQLVADAKKLTSGSDTQGFGVITSWAAGAVHPWLSLVASNGGALLKGTTPQLTSPRVKQAAELYKTLLDAGSTVPGMSNANATTTGPYLDNFVNGKTAMIIMANWWQGALKQAMGNRYRDVGTAPVPVGPRGTKSSSVSYSWLTMVNAKASPDKQAAAWKFLDWLNGPTSGKKGSSAMGDILMSMGILPSRTSDIAVHKKQLSDPFLKTYVSQLKNATPFPTVLGGQQMTEAIQKHLEALIFGKESPDAAMAAAQKEAAAILKQANG